MKIIEIETKTAEQLRIDALKKNKENADKELKAERDKQKRKQAQATIQSLNQRSTSK